MAVRLVAVEPVSHDAVLIAPGESFSVPDEAAPALLECGAARLDEARTTKRKSSAEEPPAKA